MKQYLIDELFNPDANNDSTAQAQEILGEILTNVLDASNELDNEKPDWKKVAFHSNNIKELQIQLQSFLYD